MTEPPQVLRTVEVEADPERVWEALTNQALLGDWLAPEVEIDPRPGGAIVCREADGSEWHGEIVLFEEGERLAFRWRDRFGTESRVELAVDAVAGGSRVTVTEAARASVGPRASARWELRLESLRLCLASLAYA